MKGLVFAGCSFTWGQGLYYYSKLETLREPAPDAYDSKLLTDAHKRYMQILRYPRLVANHFKTFEIVSKQNSGSEVNSINFINQVFSMTGGYNHLMDEHFSFNEIDYVIIQTSQPQRDEYYYNHNGVEKRYCINQPETKNDFYEWLFESKKSSFKEWFAEHVAIEFQKVKTLMEFIESNNIKTKILCWEDDYLPLFEADEWMKGRFIPLAYENKTYQCIRHLMNDNKNLTINSDYDNFDNPPKDHHPSMKCHEIIAQNVINSIENDKQNV